MIGKSMNSQKTKLKMKHVTRGRDSLLWTFKGGRKGVLVGVAEGVKEGLTETGIFVLGQLPFEHVQQEKEKSTAVTSKKKKQVSIVFWELGPVLSTLHKSSLKSNLSQSSKSYYLPMLHMEEANHRKFM